MSRQGRGGFQNIPFARGRPGAASFYRPPRSEPPANRPKRAGATCRQGLFAARHLTEPPPWPIFSCGRGWWNWQTRQLEVLVATKRPCRFKSCPAHQRLRAAGPDRKPGPFCCAEPPGSPRHILPQGRGPRACQGGSRPRLVFPWRSSRLSGGCRRAARRAKWRCSVIWPRQLPLAEAFDRARIRKGRPTMVESKSHRANAACCHPGTERGMGHG